MFAGNFGLSPILHPFRRNSLLCSQKLPKITKGPQFLKFKVIKAPGRSARHHALNDLVARSFASAGVPVTKKPAGLFRSDGKRPDGVSLVPWQSGKSLCWDVTVTCPLAESYVDRASHQAGSAAELAATREEDKCVDLGARYIFEPIAIETLGVFNASARQLLADLGRRISTNTGEARETSYLFQKISVLVQCFNAVLLHNSQQAKNVSDFSVA